MTKYIYTITDPRTDKVFYVGASVNVEQRAKTHMNFYSVTPLLPILKEIVESGNKPRFTIVDSAGDNWRDIERELIITLRTQGHPLANRQIKGCNLKDYNFELIDLHN